MWTAGCARGCAREGEGSGEVGGSCSDDSGGSARVKSGAEGRKAARDRWVAAGQQWKDEGGPSTAPGLEEQPGGSRGTAGGPGSHGRCREVSGRGGGRKHIPVCVSGGGQRAVCAPGKPGRCPRECTPSPTVMPRTWSCKPTNDPLLGTEAPGCGRGVPSDQRVPPQVHKHN